MNTEDRHQVGRYKLSSEDISDLDINTILRYRHYSPTIARELSIFHIEYIFNSFEYRIVVDKSRKIVDDALEKALQSE